ncbi:MAG: hypothetical protein J3T61_00090 [Candidatus Brocadiales bacterium]|nr:hypothetical protein [Candidatus Bathyanammoxibius sp.]
MENEKTATSVRFIGIVEKSGVRLAEFEWLSSYIGQKDGFVLTKKYLRRRIANFKKRSINTDPEEEALLALHEEPE